MGIIEAQRLDCLAKEKLFYDPVCEQPAPVPLYVTFDRADEELGFLNTETGGLTFSGVVFTGSSSGAARIGDTVYVGDADATVELVSIVDDVEVARGPMTFAGENVIVYVTNLFTFDGKLLFAGFMETTPSGAQPSAGYQIDPSTGVITAYTISNEVIAAGESDIIDVGDGFVCVDYSGNVQKFAALVGTIPMWTKTPPDYTDIDGIRAVGYDGTNLFVFAQNGESYAIADLDGNELGTQTIAPVVGNIDNAASNVQTGVSQKIYRVTDTSTMPWTLLGYSLTEGGAADYIPLGEITACPTVLDKLNEPCGGEPLNVRVCPVANAGWVLAGAGLTPTTVSGIGVVKSFTVTTRNGTVNLTPPNGGTILSFAGSRTFDPDVNIDGLSVVGTSPTALWDIIWVTS